MTKKLFFIIAFATILLGCKPRERESIERDFSPEASASAKGCPKRFEDSQWVYVNPRHFDEDVRHAMTTTRAAELSEKFGSPDMSTLNFGKKTQIWKHGAVRKTRIVECDGSVQDSYTTEYHLLEVVSDSSSGKPISCLVVRKVFMSKEPTPDPMSTIDLLKFYSRKTECKSWLEKNN